MTRHEIMGRLQRDLHQAYSCALMDELDDCRRHYQRAGFGLSALESLAEQRGQRVGEAESSPANPARTEQEDEK